MGLRCVCRMHRGCASGSRQGWEASATASSTTVTATAGPRSPGRVEERFEPFEDRASELCPGVPVAAVEQFGLYRTEEGLDEAVVLGAGDPRRWSPAGPRRAAGARTARTCWGCRGQVPGRAGGLPRQRVQRIHDEFCATVVAINRPITRENTSSTRGMNPALRAQNRFGCRRRTVAGPVLPDGRRAARAGACVATRLQCVNGVSAGTVVYAVST